MRRYVSAHLLDVPYHIDRAYDYYVPEHLEDEITAGSIVTVPFGVSNRRVYAVVCELKDKCEYERVKPIISVTDGRFSLSEEMLSLCFFMREQTLCTVGVRRSSFISIPTVGFISLRIRIPSVAASGIS